MNPITTARTIKSMTAAALAAAVNVSPSQLSQWESGYRTPSRDAAQRIADALDVDLAWIMGCPQSVSIWDPFGRQAIPAQLMRSQSIPGYGTLQHAYAGEIGSAVAMIISDGIVFTPADWQGSQPADASEIADCRWMDARGADAIMLDGLPRAL